MKLSSEVFFLLIRNLRPRSETSSIFLSVVFATITTCFVFYVVFYTKRWMAVKKWARVEIMPSDFEFAVFDKKKIISFRYKLGNKIYSGRRLSINARHRWGRCHPKTKAFIELAINENLPINIYVNPENPDMAFVDTEFDKDLFVILVLYVFAALIWVFMIMTINF